MNNANRNKTNEKQMTQFTHIALKLTLKRVGVHSAHPSAPTLFVNKMTLKTCSNNNGKFPNIHCNLTSFSGPSELWLNVGGTQPNGSKKMNIFKNRAHQLI